MNTISLLAKKIKEIVKNKNGIEIGGPSNNTGAIIYYNANIMDNVIFSEETVWSKHKNEYKYLHNKVGKVIINDAINIANVLNDSYDFLFASHVLEHIANPIKALKEWLRIIKNDGYLILILPEKSCSFDHNRIISSFSTILEQYNKDVGEDDLSSLPEILEKHDLLLDIQAGNFERFKERSLNNYNNRCLHHFVYNEDTLKEICSFLNCEYIYSITEGINIWFIIRAIPLRIYLEGGSTNV